MILLIEGVDGSGKTTLVKRLNIEYGIKMCTIPRNSADAYVSWKDYGERKNWYVADRSFITDLVYRLSDNEDKDYLNLLEMCDLLKHCRIVLCDTDSSFDDSMKRGEDNITTRERSNIIREDYKKVVKMLNIFQYVKYIVYDWKKDNINDVIKLLLKED